jgi:hypothetical protein
MSKRKGDGNKDKKTGERKDRERKKINAAYKHLKASSVSSLRSITKNYKVYVVT